MKVTYKWIKDFVDIHEKPEEVAKRLTSAGMEVEEIIYQNEHLHDVVVGKIVKIELKSSRLRPMCLRARLFLCLCQVQTLSMA